jgi:hypothetical protein
MIINNKRVKKQIGFQYLLMLGIVILSILDNSISGFYKDFISETYLYRFLAVVALFLVWLGYPLFRYDSDGEALVLEASEPILISKITGRKFVAEFPKNKLEDFRIRELMFKKTLYLHLRSKDKTTVLKSSISYLNEKEVSRLKRSLNKVLTNNKK